MDEKDYEVIPTINRQMLFTEVEERVITNQPNMISTIEKSDVTYSFIFKPYAVTEFTFTALYNMIFTQLTNIENISRIIIYINSVVVFDGTVLVTPITMNQNDVITINVTKSSSTTGTFKLLGNIF